MSHRASTSWNLFQKNPEQFLEQLRSTGEPIAVSTPGHGTIVVQDEESFQQLLDIKDRLETIRGVERGLKDVEAGRTRPIEEVIAEKTKKYGLPR